MANFCIDSIAELERIAVNLVSRVADFGFPPFFLHGSLGSGKTTFVSRIVSHLPGGPLCEVASPSFNICNFYKTRPPVVHCDLFRCKYAVPEDLTQAFDDGDKLVIIEWAEYLPKDLAPDNYLDFNFKFEYNHRLLEAFPSNASLDNLLAGL